MPLWLVYAVRLIFTPRSTKTMELYMLLLTNRTRRFYKLGKLRMQDDLRRVARSHSADMARKKYFDHENKSGYSPSDRNREAQVTETTTGENLAMIRGHKHPTQRAHDALLKSPGHRANILNERYNCVGIGVVCAEDGSYYTTQNFARRDVVLGSIPKSARRGRMLRLSGKLLNPDHAAAMRVNSGAPILSGRHGSLVSWSITMPDKGKEATIDVLVSTNGRHFSVANTFVVRLKRSWHW